MEYFNEIIIWFDFNNWACINLGINLHPNELTFGVLHRINAFYLYITVSSSESESESERESDSESETDDEKYFCMLVDNNVPGTIKLNRLWVVMNAYI